MVFLRVCYFFEGMVWLKVEKTIELDDEVVAPAEVKELKLCIRELDRVSGKKP